MADGRHHGKGEHDERYVAMPSMPGTRLVVVQPQFVLGRLKAILDGPEDKIARAELVCARQDDLHP